MSGAASASDSQKLWCATQRTATGLLRSAPNRAAAIGAAALTTPTANQ